jgi:hypothetical protein
MSCALNIRPFMVRIIVLEMSSIVAVIEKILSKAQLLFGMTIRSFQMVNGRGHQDD